MFYNPFLLKRCLRFRTFRYKSSLPSFLLPQVEKDGSLSLAKSYNPVEVEKGWFEYWNSQNYFEYGLDPNKKFRMVLPPPNVTGKLHLGHGLTFTIQDTLARYYRMQGYQVQLIFGFDHAGIATESIVERHLLQTKNKRKSELSKQEFLQEIDKFQLDNRKVIQQQVNRLGLSYSSKSRYFTLDEVRSEKVVETFVLLFKQKLLQKKFGLVNFCFKLNTVISDIEKLMFNVTKDKSVEVEIGYIYHIKYQLENTNTFLTVATTRPETMLGDQLLAVHPQDTRYKHLVGKYAIHPLIPSKRLQIVEDGKLVNPELHSGVVKVTPAHDFNDLNCYLRHHPTTTDAQLVQFNTFDTKGHIIDSDHWPHLSNLHRLEARAVIVGYLQRRGLVAKVPIEGNYIVQRCSKSGDLVEPQFKPQWFLDLPQMKPPTQRLLDSNQMEFLPPKFQVEFQRWVDNLKEWCVSRQLVWGHRIPAYTCTLPEKGSLTEAEYSVYRLQLKGRWFVDVNLERVHQQMLKVVDGNSNLLGKLVVEQDPDVLDTWFSSALLPLTTNLDWKGPHANQGLEDYSTDLMETGSDILFFWVIRMTLLCTHLTKDSNTNQPPFQQILLHPMVRDRMGRKMSKSLGNVVDLLHLIDGIDVEGWKTQLADNSYLPPDEKRISERNFVKEFPQGMQPNGADALRFALLSYLQQGRQINLNLDIVQSGRHFGNKLWQITKYYLHLKKDLQLEVGSYEEHGLTTPAQHYLVHHLHLLIQECTEALEQRQLYKLPLSLRSFVESNLSDQFIQLTKGSQEVQDVLVLETTLKAVLQLLHPVMPFLTETLWIHTHYPNVTEPLIIQKYPQVQPKWKVDSKEVDRFEMVLEVLKMIRKVKLEKENFQQVDLVGLELKEEVDRFYLGRIQRLTKVQVVLTDANTIDKRLQPIPIPNTKLYLLPKWCSPNTNLTASLELDHKLLTRKFHQRLSNLKKLVKLISMQLDMMEFRQKVGYAKVKEVVKEKHNLSLQKIHQEIGLLEKKLEE